MTRLLRAPDEEAALEELHALGCTDGLPVVVPTVRRVERMVLAGGLDADLALGAMGPASGEATVENVAIAAVMAGCLPDHFPVVLAAVRAVADPAFDLTEVQATTHDLGPVVVVNGPARSACGLASGFGALGPGHRANASIGRALRLAMVNVGGGRPGVSDMALLGHPGKFSSCLAEAEEESPFPPLHTSLGYDASQSAVTVVGVEAPHSVISVGDADDPTSPDRLLRSLAAALASPANNNANFSAGTVVVALNPDHARVLADAGYDRAGVQAALAERAVNRRGALRALNPAYAGRGADDDLVPALASPANAVVLVAGGSGIYSAVLPSWGAGPHANPAVTKEVELDQACAIPGLAGAATATS